MGRYGPILGPIEQNPSARIGLPEKAQEQFSKTPGTQRCILNTPTPHVYYYIISNFMILFVIIVMIVTITSTAHYDYY